MQSSRNQSTKIGSAIFAAVTLVGLSAYAVTTEAPAIVTSSSTTALSAVTMAAARTSAAIDVRSWAIAKVTINFGGAGAGTDIHYYIEESDDGSTGWSKVMKCDGDTCTLFNPTYTTGSAIVWTTRPDVTGMSYIRIVVDSTSGDASDIVTATVRKARGI